MCVISALAAVATQDLLFTTGVYIAPARDLITVAKSVGTAAVLSDNRVRPRGRGRLVQGGVRPDGPGLPHPGQAARRDDRGAARPVGGGWVEYHGTYYDVPECQMEPSPTAPVPIIGGRPLRRRPAPHRRPVRRLDRGRRLHRGRGLGPPRRAARRCSRRPGATGEGFAIYLSLNERPTWTCTGASRTPGVTDFVCAPWMGVNVAPGTPETEALAARLGRRAMVRRRDRRQGLSDVPGTGRTAQGGAAREGHEDRTAAGLLGLGSAPQRRRAGGRGRAPRLRLGLDGRVLRLRRPDPPGLVGVADRAGAPGHRRCASCRPAPRRPWPWPP